MTPDGTGTCTQAAPCNLATALGQARDGDAIILASGRYTGPGPAVATIDRSITLYGGWDEAPVGLPQRRPRSSILDGEGTRRGLIVTAGISVTLDGISIRNGKAAGSGAGLYAQSARITVRNVEFERNIIDIYDEPNSLAYGGAVYLEGGELYIEDSMFLDNSAWANVSSYGGALAIVDTEIATITNTSFVHNEAWIGSCIWFSNNRLNSLPSLVMSKSFFSANGFGLGQVRASCGYASALEAINSRVILMNNLIAVGKSSIDRGAVSVIGGEAELIANEIINNTSGGTSAIHLESNTRFLALNNIVATNYSSPSHDQSPAICIRNSTGHFLHNTIANNHSEYGVLLDGSTTAWFTNTILVSQPVGISVGPRSQVALNGTLWGSGQWANGRDWDGSGRIVTGTVNLWADPQFQEPMGHPYRLGPGSAAIDAGVDSGVQYDIDGDPRPSGKGYDIGADEYAAGPTEPTATPEPTAPPKPPTLYLPTAVRDSRFPSAAATADMAHAAPARARPRQARRG